MGCTGGHVTTLKGERTASQNLFPIAFSQDCRSGTEKRDSGLRLIEQHGPG